MSLNGAATNEQIDASMSAIALLNASCQAVVEAEIQQVSSGWYETLDQQLGAAEELVLQWRRSGFLYFQGDILGAIAAAGRGFLGARASIDAQFAALEANFSPAGQTELTSELKALAPPVQAIADEIGAYLARLRTFEGSMSGVQQQMTATVAQVQAQEAEIQSEIASIKQQIASLTAQVQTDRDAIAKARSARTSGIVETIFGILLAPVTGGASLILAGIGVASIAEAEGKIDSMESEISSYQQSIAADQTNLTSDQKVVATLDALTMSTGIVLSDITEIGTALDALRTQWTAFGGELDGVVDKVARATAAADLVVSQAWYDSACTEWEVIAKHVADLQAAGIDTNRVTIG